ncbi:MAG: hypothetical protein SGI90_16030 [Candidatus Eisenbacteria bacterium]|nr:hypothetical protein [Candidatus Eisenbacteria bacterium]
MKHLRLALVAHVVLSMAAVTVASAGPVLPFVDDYKIALTQAREKRLPIFIEAWAPW